MKKYLFLSGALLLLFVSQTNANANEDRSDWSGLNLGLTSGYSINEAYSKGHASGGGYWAAQDIPVVDDVVNRNLDQKSPFIGIDFGYNIQSNKWVFGLETGAYYYNVDESNDIHSPYPTNATGFNVSSEIETNWLLTLAPKVGYVFDDFMLELSGGLAATEIKTSYTLHNEVNGRYASAQNSENKLGLLLGTALNYKLSDDWSLKAKYQFLTFGEVGAQDYVAFGGTSTTSQIRQAYRVQSHLLGLGLNYHF